MKIAFNPSTVAALTAPPNNKDITFDLRGRNIFARGVKFQGTDTNTWRSIQVNGISIGTNTLNIVDATTSTKDGITSIITKDTWRQIKINNVSIGTNILDLRNGSNTTLINSNGIVTINSTWRPVVDNLTSDSTTSSLSAKQGKVLAGLINGKSDSEHTHDGRYVRAFGTTNDDIDSDWGQSFKTFDPIPSGTPPEKNPNISLLSIGENFNRRKQLAFIYSNDNIYYRRHVNGSFTDWRRLAFANEIPGSLKNPHALTISLNGTSQGPYDGSAAKSINITPGSIGAATSGHNHDGRYVYNYGGTQMDGASRNKNALGMSTTSGISGDWWHILQAAWNDEYRWNSQIAFPTQNRNGMYYRSGLDDNTKWGAWVKLLDTGNSSISGNTITINGSSLTVSKSDHNHDYLVVNEADEKSFNSAYHNFQVLYADGGNGITGRPDNVDAFGLIRLRAAWGWSGQMLLANGGSLYIRSSADAQMTNTLAWRTILDSSNYSSILDSRYYTESEIDTKLAKKLDRVKLTTGSWNPRSYNLAADYHYNGGDLSISETGGQIHVSVDGKFWQNEGQYRVLDTSDIAGIRGSVTLYQYLSSTDNNWFPLVWGGSDHKNTNNSTGSLYKSHDKLSWQTSSQTLYATNIRTENIKNLSIGGGIYWNPYVESATDGSDAASITLVKSGVAGGTTLVLSQQNDASDTIQFKTNTTARLYHNSNQILTSGDTKVSSGKGYINNTEITQVNNSDTLDGWHKDNIQGTGYITSSNSLTSYWFKMYDITVTGYQYNDITITFLVSEGYTAHFSIFYLKIRQNGTNNSGNYNLVVTLRELVGNLRDKVVAYYNNSTGNVQLWGNTDSQWGTMNYTIIKKTTRTATDSSSLGTLTAQSFSSVQTPPSTGYTKLTMSRVGSVSYSDSTGSVHWNNVTNKPSTFNPAAHTHIVFKNNLMIKGTNGISDSASIHLGIGDSDTGFKWISDGKCQIYANNVAIGEWTSGGMNWLRNPTVNGNKVWNAGNDGSGSGLDADTVDGYHSSSFLTKHTREGAYNIDHLTDFVTRDLQPKSEINIEGTKPYDGWGIVTVLKTDNGTAQLVFDGGNNMYFRSSYGAENRYVTSDWKYIIHSSNIGSQSVNYANSAGNSDKLNGYHESSFVHWLGNKKFSEFATIYNGGIYNMDGNPNGVSGLVNNSWNQTVFNVSNYSDTRQKQLIFRYDSDEVYYRRHTDSGWSSARIIAFTDSNIASATKLQTARNLWGQSFNGTSDVNGTIYINNGDSSNGAIRLNNNVNANARISAIGGQVIFNTGAAIRFGETTWDWNKWAGLKYDSSTKTIYLGIADDSVFNANSAQGGGTINLKAGISTIEAPNISFGNVTSGLCNGLEWTCGDNDFARIKAGAGGGSDGYLEIATADDGTEPIYVRQYTGNFKTIARTLTLLDANGNTHIPKQIIREASSRSWVEGRAGALVRETTSTGYHTLWSLKTTNGSWDFGEYNTPGWNNVPVMSYVTDSDFNVGNNTTTHQIKFPLDSGTVALTKNIPSKLPADGGNADTVDGYHANGLFTAFGNNGHNITATIGGVTKSFLVNYAADADKVDGYHVNTGQSPFGRVPTIGDDGVMEIGKYIDFHNDNGGKYDYSTRLQSTGNHQNTLNLPSKSGTLALTSDIKDTNTWRPISDDYEKGDASTSLSTLGSLTLYNDLLGSIPNPTSYYWANIKVSSSSSTTTSPTVNVLTATRVCAGHDPGISNSISCSNWFRSSGETGWYSSTYGGGWYMSDKDWIRSWGSKALYINNSIRSTNYQVMYGSTSASAARLESTTTLVYGTDTSSNSINSYLRGTTVTLQVKKGTSINHNALQLTADYIYCNNYCDMKQGAVVSGGNFTVNNNSYLAQSAGAKVGIGTSSLSDSLSVNGSMNVKLTNVNWDKACTDKSLVIRKTTLDPSKVNSYEYVSKVLTFQFGDGTHSNNRGTCTVSVPAGYKIQMDVYDLKTTHNRPIANIQVSGTNTLQMTLGGGYYISGTDSANVSYFLVPDASLDFPKTTVPQLLIADSTIQFQNSDKLLALTNKGVYINGAVNLQINGYHKQPIFIASAIYNKSSWNTIGCKANAALITCNTPIADCTVNDFIVQYSGVTVTSVRIEHFKFVCVLGSTSSSYYGVQIYYMPH